MAVTNIAISMYADERLVVTLVVLSRPIATWDTDCTVK